MKRVRVQVSGRVQGVGFRYFVRTHAVRLGVGGTVRNCPDGTVELVAEGSETAVDALLGLVREGPRWAQVDQVMVHREEPDGCRSFEIIG